MYSELIIAGGIFHFGFAIFHLFFWKLFKWEKDLKSLSFINRAVMQIFNICLIIIFLLAGFISIFYSYELVSTELGHAILVSISVFWFLRLIQQIFFFGLTKLFSVILSILFLLGGIIYIAPVL